MFAVSSHLKWSSFSDRKKTTTLLADIATDIEEDGEWNDHSGIKKMILQIMLRNLANVR